MVAAGVPPQSRLHVYANGGERGDVASVCSIAGFDRPAQVHPSPRPHWCLFYNEDDIADSDRLEIVPRYYRQVVGVVYLGH